MKPIFNSLGSNYSLADAVFALGAALGNEQAVRQHFLDTLAKKFSGKAFGVYKGRQAIEFALKAFDIGQGDGVLTQALSCFAVEEGITGAGASPIYYDIKADSLQPSFTSIKKNYTPKVKALIVQYTLGTPCDITSIQSWCQDKGIILIEDLAQSFGASDFSGNQLGSFGQVVVCSFGRDKIIDCVSGGAVIIRDMSDPDSQYYRQVTHAVKRATSIHNQLQSVESSIVVRDRMYPILTWIVRNTHQIGFGKVLFQIAKQVGLLTSPVVSPVRQIKLLPGFEAAFGIRVLLRLNKQLTHRRAIGANYFNHLSQSIENAKNNRKKKKKRSQNTLIKFVTTQDELKYGSNQRFAVWVEDVHSFIRFMKKNQVFVSDRWYRKPVDSGSIVSHSVYSQGSCPHAEEMANHLINLPTHQNISISDTKRIVALISKYYSH